MSTIHTLCGISEVFFRMKKKIKKYPRSVKIKNFQKKVLELLLGSFPRVTKISPISGRDIFGPGIPCLRKCVLTRFLWMKSHKRIVNKIRITAVQYIIIMITFSFNFTPNKDFSILMCCFLLLACFFFFF